MYCIHCGKELSDTDVFCLYCGKHVPVEGQTPGDLEQMQAEKAAEIPPQPGEFQTGAQEIPPQPSGFQTGAQEIPPQPGAFQAGGQQIPPQPGAFQTGAQEIPPQPGAFQAGAQEIPPQPGVFQAGAQEIPPQPGAFQAGGQQIPPQPGAFQTGGQAAPAFVPGKRSAIKPNWVVLGVLGALAVAAGIGLFSFFQWYNAPLQIYQRAMEQEDYGTAAAQIEYLEPEDREQAENVFLQMAQTAYEDYNAGEAEYEEAFETVSQMEEYCPTEEVKQVRSEMIRLRFSKNEFEKAEKKRKHGDYADAIKAYKAVIQEDTLYGEAWKKLPEVMKDYKNQTIVNAKGWWRGGEHEAAIWLLEEYGSVMGPDPQITMMLSEYNEEWDKIKRQKYYLSQGLSENGKYWTVEDMRNSDDYETSGLKAALEGTDDPENQNYAKAEGNTWYRIVPFSDISSDEMYLYNIEGFQNSLNEDTELLEALKDFHSALKAFVEEKDLVVVLVYETNDGVEIARLEYRGEG